MKRAHCLATVLAAALAAIGGCCAAHATGPAAAGGATASDESIVYQPAETIVIPGPLRSFLRMAGISQESAPAEVLPLMARNAFLYGRQLGKKTEYLILESRYVQQARELEPLAAANGSIHIEGCGDAAPLIQVLGYQFESGCSHDGA